MHVLGVAGIHDGYGVAVDGIGEIPLVGVGHVVVAPTFQRGLAPEKGAFDLIDGIEGVIKILMHHLFRIGMFIFLRNIMIERVDFPEASFADVIYHGLAYSFLIVS